MKIRPMFLLRKAQPAPYHYCSTCCYSGCSSSTICSICCNRRSWRVSKNKRSASLKHWPSANSFVSNWIFSRSNCSALIFFKCISWCNATNRSSVSPTLWSVNSFFISLVLKAVEIACRMDYTQNSVKNISGISSPPVPPYLAHFREFIIQRHVSLVHTIQCFGEFFNLVYSLLFH